MDGHPAAVQLSDQLDHALGERGLQADQLRVAPSQPCG